MNGFFVLDVPEFASLVDAAMTSRNCKLHPKAGNYLFVEFEREIEILREDTAMSDAVWYGCLTAGLIGKISRFDKDRLKIVATNEPMLDVE